MMAARAVRPLGWLLVLFGSALVVGCGDSYDGRLEVSGNVTLVGEPLKDGDISFVPLEGQGSKTGTGISNGVYNIPKKNGLKPGKYIVEITAGDGKTPASNEEAAAPGGSTNIVSVDLIPEDWNINSKKQIEVKAGSPNKFDFAIPTKNAPKGGAKKASKK